ncbi:glycoside hydrolase family 97 C-terminal domain-containing protein [Pedobacter sp. NJ-S-72]
MFCDNPSNYLKEPVYTHYIARFPTIWDKTIALEGKISEYAVVARKNGNNWYIGGMTNWDARAFDIPLTFLEGKKYKIEILKDGINVGKHAADYQIISKEVSAGETLHIDMAAGGGYTAILTPIG